MYGGFLLLPVERFRDEKVDHPTQKPLSISNRIVQHFSNEGDLVVVPFAGSGTECLAARINKRKYVGFELNPDYIEIAQKRIDEYNEEKAQDLFA